MQEIVGKDNQLWEDMISKQKSKTDKVKEALVRLFKEIQALKEVYING